MRLFVAALTSRFVSWSRSVFALLAAKLKRGPILYSDALQHAVACIQYMSNQLTSAHLAFVCLAVNMADTAETKQYLCTGVVYLCCVLCCLLIGRFVDVLANPVGM